VCPHRFKETCECKSGQLSSINRLPLTMESIFNDPS